MTTDTTPTEPTPGETDSDQTPIEPTPPADTETDTEQHPERDKAGKEAAKYRRQVREVEAQRDELREQVTTLQRAAAEDAATRAGLKPAALWASGTTIEQLIGDDGTISPDAINEAITAARAALGIPDRRNVAPREGNSAPPSRSRSAWTSAFVPSE